MLLEDPLHAFEPTRHVGGVMFRIVKIMWGTIHNMATMHFGAILVMCPSGTFSSTQILYQKMSPVIQELFLIVLGMQLFKTTIVHLRCK